MTHPITPPPELIEDWIEQFKGDHPIYIATHAAKWGADQELEACCEEFSRFWDEVEVTLDDVLERLRAARRPKPPSLKEQALLALSHLLDGAAHSMDTTEPADYIRRALEQLDD